MGILGEGGAYGTDGGGQLEGFEDNDETGDTLQRYDDTTIRRYDDTRYIVIGAWGYRHRHDVMETCGASAVRGDHRTI